jgi:uncharacterized membrane protein
LAAGGIWWALAGALTWCYAGIAWRVSTGRRASTLLWLTTLGLTAQSVLAFASGDTYVYFLQPVLTELVVAALFGASLVTARPMTARLARDFYPMTDALHDRPRVRQLFRRLTLLWTVLLGTKALCSLWLLHVAPLSEYVAFKSIAGPSFAIVGATISVVLSARVARREGLLGPRGITPALAPAV